MGRALKNQVLNCLMQDDFPAAVESLLMLPARKVINPLFGCFCHPDELVKWHAVSTMGIVVDRLAQSRIESARVILRRLMWSLNDESGGIGWGAPEAMGDILARNSTLAGEYHRILLSYINPEGNYIEYEPLQRGVLWGVGRFVRCHPDLALCAVNWMANYATSQDAALRGLSVWGLKAFKSLPAKLQALLDRLADDSGEVSLYVNYRLFQCRVGQIVRNNSYLENC